MSAIPVKMVKQAQIAFDLLPPEDRAALEAAVSQLLGKAPEQWPREIVKPISIPENELFYEIRFTPDLRAFVVPGADGGVEVEQIFHRGILRWFRSPKSNGGVPG